MSLKITKVTSATVEGNYHWIYARVYAGEIYGTGEGFFAPELEAVVNQFGRLLIGEDALEINRLLEKMRWASIPSGFSGVNAHAISGDRNQLFLISLENIVTFLFTLCSEERFGKKLEFTSILTLENLWKLSTQYYCRQGQNGCQVKKVSLQRKSQFMDV